MNTLLINPVWNRKQGDHFAQWTSASIHPSQDKGIGSPPELSHLSPYRCSPFSYASSVHPLLIATRGFVAKSTLSSVHTSIATIVSYRK
jgi:hypothetical protein